MPTAVFIVVALSIACFLLIAVRVQDRTQNADDFLLARRRLPRRISELGSAFAQLPLWLSLAVAIAAFEFGLAAIWTALAIFLGVVLSTFWIAPRARAQSMTLQAPTLARLLSTHSGEQLHIATRVSVTLIITLCLTLSVSVQLQWLATALAQLGDISFVVALLACGGITLLGGLLGGFWAAAFVDAVLAGITLLLAIAVLIAAMYSSTNVFGALTAPDVQPLWLRNPHQQILALAYGVGVSFLATSGLAQPAAIARALARKDNAARWRWLAPCWSAFILLTMLLLGWCARLLQGEKSAMSPMEIVGRWVSSLLTPLWAQSVIALLFCSGVAALLSAWIAIASHLAHDTTRSTLPRNLLAYRLALIVAAGSSICIAYWWPISGFERLWFAWHTLGASLAPLLIVRLTGKRVRPASGLGSIWAGFALTAIFHAMPDSQGDLLERAVPFIAAMGIALSGGERRRNSGRADRAEQTVHDRLPI